MVAALEFEGHVGDPGVVHRVVVVVEATGPGHDLFADFGGGGDGGLGGDLVFGQAMIAGADLCFDARGEAKGGREDCQGELHGSIG